MPQYGQIACFTPVIKEREWELENGKKSGVLAIQKVAKTGNNGKKNSSGRRYWLCKIPQHAEGKLELSVTMREMTQD